MACRPTQSTGRHFRFGFVFAALACAGWGAAGARAANLARWDFEDQNITVDEGAGTMSASHNTGEAFVSGNNSSFAYSLSGWAITDVRTSYFQFDVPTTGRSNITVSFDERRSGTGIHNFEVLYSTDGTNFIALPNSATIVPDDTNFRHQEFSFASITALNNNANAKFRIAGYNAESTGGTWRIDNVLFREATPPSGCCIAGACSLRTAADCCAAHGNYLGDSTTCGGGCPTYTGIAINEIRIDQDSDDVDHYFELYGPVGATLNGLTYLVIGDSPAGASGVIEAVVPLSGRSIPAGGYFLVAEDTDTCTRAANLVAPLNFENGDNVTHMLVSGFCGDVGDSIDANTDCIIDVTLPWASIVDKIAIISEQNPPLDTECHYGPPVIGPAPGASVPWHVLRLPDGPSGTWTIGIGSPICVDDTPGASNSNGACCSGSPPSTCQVRTLQQCQSLGGVFKGSNTNCSQNICVGACCTNGTCSVIPQSQCQSNGGTYFGDTVPCPAGGSCCRTTADAETVANTAGRSVGVKLCDVVVSSTVDTVESPDYRAFQVQDATGGVTVYGPTVAIDLLLANGGSPVNAGTRIDIQGSTDSFRDLFELVGGSVPLSLVNKGAAGIPAPAAVTAADFRNGSTTGEALESKLVSLDCVSFLNVAPGSIFSAWDRYLVSDGTYTVTVLVAAATSQSLPGTIIPVDTVKLTGIFSQASTTTNTGYYLIIRTTTDLTTSTCTKGACCMPDGTCRIAAQAACIGAEGTLGHGGQYRGNGTTCPPNPVCQAYTGACCTGDSCAIRTRAQCASSGGIYIGDNATCPAQCPNPDRVFISELRTDQPSFDLSEYVELRGPANTPLDTLTYIVIGDNTSASPYGVIDSVTTLEGSMIPADGYFLFAKDTFQTDIFGSVVNLTTTFNFENSDNVTHMLVKNFTGTNGQDLDTNDDGVLDAQPWTSIVSCVALVGSGSSSQDLVYCGTHVGPGENGTVPVQMARCDGPPVSYQVGALDPTAGSDTPGAPNSSCTTTPCSCKGDMDRSGVIDKNDIPLFVNALLSAAGDACADVNTNGTKEGTDISAFVKLVLANSGAGTQCSGGGGGPQDFTVTSCQPADSGCAIQAGTNRFCQYYVAATQDIPQGYTSCVAAGQIAAFEPLCTVCPSPLPAGLCGPLGGAPLLFKWQAPNGGADCYMKVTPLQSSSCRDCADTSSAKRYRFVP